MRSPATTSQRGSLTWFGRRSFRYFRISVPFCLCYLFSAAFKRGSWTRFNSTTVRCWRLSALLSLRVTGFLGSRLHHQPANALPHVLLHALCFTRLRTRLIHHLPSPALPFRRGLLCCYRFLFSPLAHRSVCATVFLTKRCRTLPLFSRFAEPAFLYTFSFLLPLHYRIAFITMPFAFDFVPLRTYLTVRVRISRAGLAHTALRRLRDLPRITRTVRAPSVCGPSDFALLPRLVFANSWVGIMLTSCTAQRDVPTKTCHSRSGLRCNNLPWHLVSFAGAFAD